MDEYEQYELASRDLPDGRRAYIIPLTYGRARICISNKYSPLFIDNSY